MALVFSLCSQDDLMIDYLTKEWKNRCDLELVELTCEVRSLVTDVLYILWVRLS